MKIKVTLLTKNDKPISVLGNNPEEKIKEAWETLASMINYMSKDPSESAEVLDVEILPD